MITTTGKPEYRRNSKIEIFKILIDSGTHSIVVILVVIIVISIITMKKTTRLTNLDIFTIKMGMEIIIGNRIHMIEKLITFVIMICIIGNYYSYIFHRAKLYIVVFFITDIIQDIIILTGDIITMIIEGTVTTLDIINQTIFLV